MSTIEILLTLIIWLIYQSNQNQTNTGIVGIVGIVVTIIIGIFGAHFAGGFKWLNRRIKKWKEGRAKKFDICNELIKDLDEEIERNVKTLTFSKTGLLSGGWRSGVSKLADELYHQYYNLYDKGVERRKLAERDLEKIVFQDAFDQYIKNSDETLQSNIKSISREIVELGLFKQDVDVVWLQKKHLIIYEERLRKDLAGFFKHFNQLREREITLKLVWEVHDELISLAEKMKNELKRVRDKRW